MDQVYFVCAVLGGTIFVGQFLMGLLGFGDHHDAGGLDHDFDTGSADHSFGDHDHGHLGHGAAHGSHETAATWLIGLLSFRTVVAGMTFFGLAGLAAQKQWGHPGMSLLSASVSGAVALYLVAWTMKTLSKLRADGTVQIRNTVGETAVVYLTIPGQQAGKGKVTVTVQNRTMEYEALTESSTLPTGTAVRIVSVVDPETLAVEAVSS